MSNESIRIYPSGCLYYSGTYKHILSCDGECLLSKNDHLWTDSSVHKLAANKVTLQVDLNDLRCNSCHDVFHTFDRYVQHLNGRRHIKNYESYINKTQFICPICKLPTTSQSSLAQHARKHVSIAEHFCKICGKEFASKESLFQHLDTPSHIHAVEYADLSDS